MGSKANQALSSVDKYDLLVSSARMCVRLSLDNPLPLLVVFTVVLIAVLYWFFGTEMGCSLRATGANPNMARAQGINTNANVVLGLMVSNGLVALSGATAGPVSGFLRHQHGPGRHRHWSGRRHHRRSGLRQGIHATSL